MTRYEAKVRKEILEKCASRLATTTGKTARYILEDLDTNPYKFLDTLISAKRNNPKVMDALCGAISQLERVDDRAVLVEELKRRKVDSAYERRFPVDYRNLKLSEEEDRYAEAALQLIGDSKFMDMLVTHFVNKN